MDIGSAYLGGIYIQGVFSLVIVLVIILVGISIFGLRKSQSYRKHIADMYVAAKIKFFAEEDGLDLVAEEKCFKSWIKKQSMYDKDVDSAVAEELKERIAESSDEKKDNKQTKQTKQTK